MSYRNALLLLTALGAGPTALLLTAGCGPGDSCEVTLTCEGNSGPGGQGGVGGTGASGPGGSGPGGSGPGGSGGAGGSASTCGNGTVEAGEVCFGEPAVYDTGSVPNFSPGSDVILADCDTDGDLDVISHIDGYLQFLRNDGNGQLAELSTYPLPSDALGLALGDVHVNPGAEILVTYGPAYTDIMGMNTCTGELLGVLYHNGPQGVDTQATAIDINGSGVDDYAILLDNSLAFGVDGATPTEVDSSCTDGTGMVAGQFDGDGFEDLVYTDAGTGSIRWAKGDGSGVTNSFGAKLDVTSSPIALAAGDLDGDGDPDVAVLDNQSATVSVLRNNSGPSNLQFSKLLRDVSVAGTNGVHAAGPMAITMADVDADGDLDVVTANTDDGPGLSSISLLLNDGDGNLTLASGFPVEVSRRPAGIAAADINADGAVDIVTAHDFDDNGTRHISVLLAIP